MRTLTFPVVFIALIALAPCALASPGPMSEEELVAQSSHIVTGEITEVTCSGDPAHDGQAMVTPYLATLTVTGVEQGDEITSATLPFATTVYDADADVAMCSGGGPIYLLGDKGTFYLMQDASQDAYTLTSAMNGFAADDDSAGQDLPVCEVTEPEGDTTDDASTSDDGGCAGGGSGAPLSIALFTLCLAATLRRRLALN